ncbi:MAG: hypothetical protein ACRDMJ_04790, partial [Solirubrobacteraceae bacterium]
QARGDEAGPQADLYSLGVVAYQLISGRLPYEAASLSELALKQQRESPIPLDELRPEAPHALAQAVALALAIDQRVRPTDAIELADALRDGAHGVSPRHAPVLDSSTSATRISPGAPTAATHVARAPVDRPAQSARTPRQVPARRPPRAEVAAYARRQPAELEPPQRSGRGFRRLMAFAALIAVLAIIVIVAVTISSSTSSTVVHYRKVVAHDVNSAVSQIQSIISQYTK